MFWGLSEALDLYQEYLNALKKTITTEKTNVPQAKVQDNDGENCEEHKNEDQNLEGNNEVENIDSDGKDDNKKTTDDDEAADLETVRQTKETQNDVGVEINSDEIKNIQIDSDEIKNIQIDEDNAQTPREAAGEEDMTPRNAPPTINILLFGAGDPRHIIKTMSKLYTHRKQQDENGDAKTTAPIINIYMIEGCVEIIARNIALLSIALENQESFNLLTKVHIFMDIYGNTLLRPSSHQYLVAKAKILQDMIADKDQLQRLAPMLNIDGLRYRERDGLQNAFNFWLPKPEHVFNIKEYWDLRLRKMLGTRYDHRDGVFDWDLNMQLKYREANQICSQEYRYWRETGIAFTYPEYEQCKSNKTYACGLTRNGSKFLHRGYVGDAETGPFCTFGIKCSDERMHKSMHGENDFRSTDITERNLLEYFHELQTSTHYEHDVELSRKLGCTRMLMGKRLTWDECDVGSTPQYDKPWINTEGVRVRLLSADDILTLQNVNERWRNFFDVAFVAHNYFAFIKPPFIDNLRDNALLILETKLMTVARRENVIEFENKLKNYAKESKLVGVINYSAINTKNSVLKFKKVPLSK